MSIVVHVVVVARHVHHLWLRLVVVESLHDGGEVIRQREVIHACYSFIL